jgi:phosphogluconate dehydratase
MKLHPVIEQVTQRIRQRSAATRSAYLAQVKAAAQRDRGVDRMGCANVAHALAAMPEPDKAMAMPRYVSSSALPSNDKFKVIAEKAPNIGIVNAYNDMLSAHAPLASFPAIIKDELRQHGATAQVAGGVPAMCDGVTQGTAGMELSLFSRDNIAQGTAIALSHDVFDGALMLGVCDKIVPGLLIGALHFGHLPMVFVPAGPMTSGLSNSEKAKVREQAAQGLVGRKELLEAENKAYHGPGTCTFYGTANSNQMLLEAMGLHVPGTAFVNPDEATGTNLRELLTREAARTALRAVKDAKRIGELVDERCIVNAMVALLATGGSTNHLIHWVAVARAAGIVIDWDDFSQLSDVVPLLSRVYPNGTADVNQFQAAGGPGYVIRELLDAGFMHADVLTVSSNIRDYTKIPAVSDNKLLWSDAGASKNTSIVRPATEPFSVTGGLKLLQGNLGRSVIKVSAVPEDRHIIEAPAKIFDSQEQMLAAFKAGELEKDVVVVVRWQGPRANGVARQRLQSGAGD